MRKNITQYEAVFYRLYKEFRAKSDRYIPVHEFMGEIYCEPLGKWGYVSHECSARASELHSDNPELIQRDPIIGKSGAKYFGYRINPAANPSMIRDPHLLAFYRKISGAAKPRA